jgi:hypothetical protein
MKKDKHITKVVFIEFDCGDGTTETTALFPFIEADKQGNILCYAHIGQHGAATPELLVNERLSTYSEYEALLNELQSIGYNLYPLRNDLKDFLPVYKKHNLEIPLPF